MSMYGKNHYTIVISLQLIKINGKKKEIWVEDIPGRGKCEVSAKARVRATTLAMFEGK